MKLEKIQIESFRAIERVELSFTDELLRVLPQIPIVGPNTSGKTSILDAITLCLGPSTEIFPMRPDLSIHPSSIVRRGAVRARVTSLVRFSDQEIAETKEVFERIQHPAASRIPNENHVEVTWEYPDPEGRHRLGRTSFSPEAGYLLFKGRKLTTKSFHVPGVTAQRLTRLGGVFMFDQTRSGLRMPTRGGRQGEEGSEDEQVSFTSDPRTILLHLASRAAAAQGPETTEREDFDRLKDLYARVCKPHRIKGLYNTEAGLDIEFEGPRGSYLFDGLSSGQSMLLLLLLKFARNRIHSSIVLIDELELHLHPLWQARLFHSLGELGFDNQIFFTTHSLHLRDLIQDQFFHATGELGDRGVEKVEV